MARALLPRCSFHAEYCAEVRDIRARPRGPDEYVAIADIGGHHLLDCWQFSNWTGFINHGEPEHANVLARLFGDRHDRVGIYVGDADILPFRELLLCYSDGMTEYFAVQQATKDKAFYNRCVGRKEQMAEDAQQLEARAKKPKLAAQSD